jgi:nucleotide-binding universal stress UspA family protein
MKILICTDGSPASIQSAELVSKLGFPKETQITVLGVSENIEHLANLTEAMDKINKSLGSIYVLDKKYRNGDPIEEIMSEAVESTYDLVAVGGGRGQLGLLHPKLGSTTSKLARKLHTHFLVARNIPEKICKVLFCAGIEAQSSRTMKLGGAWISNTSAQVKLLHVLPKEKQGSASGDSIINQGSQQLRDSGLEGDIETQIRRGLIVEEVLNELTEGGYELLVVGAHYQPGQDRWQGTLLDDVTDQLLNQSFCSVLII